MQALLNMVFMGNFLYPHGMAETKRIQYAIDYLHEGIAATTSVLLLRQSHIGRDEANLSGVHRGTPYRTIGHNIQQDCRSPLLLFNFLRVGIKFLRGAYRRERKNILYVYMGPNIENIIFIVLARLIGYKVIFDITEDYLFVGDNPSLASIIKSRSACFFEKRIALLADAVLVISSYLREKFERIVKGKIPVKLLPISVNIDYIPFKKSSLYGPLIVLYAGSFGEKDPVEILIEAVNTLCAEGHDVKLVLAGMGLPERMAIIMEKINDSPFKDKIRFIGYLPDADYFKLLSECDALCMIRTSSLYAHAGFPFKLGEYLATGKPTIASCVGDVPFYLQDRISALLVDPGSPRSLVEALKFVINDPKRATEVGLRGRQVAREYFDVKVVYSRLLDVLSRL